MKKILILGDYEKAIYHPLTGVEDELKSIIGDKYEITSTGDYNALLTLSDYDLFITYTDGFKAEPISDEFIASLITYVANGGPMFALHYGVNMESRKEYAHIIGGRFASHPQMETLPITVVKDDEITKGLPNFETFEEPYQYAFDEYSDLTILTEYTYRGKQYPNSWKKKFGKGEVVYFMNGHTAEHFKEEGNRIFIKNAVEYLLK